MIGRLVLQTGDQTGGGWRRKSHQVRRLEEEHSWLLETVYTVSIRSIDLHYNIDGHGQCCQKLCALLTVVVCTPHSSNFSKVGVAAFGVWMNSKSLSELYEFWSWTAIFAILCNRCLFMRNQLKNICRCVEGNPSTLETLLKLLKFLVRVSHTQITAVYFWLIGSLKPPTSQLPLQ